MLNNNFIIFNQLINLNKNNLLNAISGMLGFTIPILALIFTSPYIISNLGEESYGVINFTSLLISYLLLLDCAYEVVLTKTIASNTNKIDLYTNQSLLVYITIAIIGLICTCLFSIPYSFYLVNIDDTKRWDLFLTLLLTGISFISLMIYTWNKSLANGLGNYLVSNFFYVCFNLFGIIAGIVVVFLGGDFLEYTFYRTLVWVIMIPVYLYHTNKYIAKLNLQFNKTVFSLFFKNASFGFRLRLSEQFLNRADQLLITILFDLKTVAYFSVCFIVYNACTLLVRKMVEFTLPKFSAIYQESNFVFLNLEFVKYFELTASLVLLIFGTTLFIGNDLLNVWLGTDFANHSSMIFFNMILGGILSGISIIILSYYLIATGNYNGYTRFLTIRSFFYLFLFILMSFIFDFSIDSISYLFILNGFIDFIYLCFSLKKVESLNLSLLNFKFISYFVVLILFSILFNLYRSSVDLSFNVFNLMLLVFIYVCFYIFVSVIWGYPKVILSYLKNKIKH